MTDSHTGKLLFPSSLFALIMHSYLNIQYGGQQILLYILSCHSSKIGSKRQSQTWRFYTVLKSEIFFMFSEVRKVAGETLQRRWWTSLAAGCTTLDNKSCNVEYSVVFSGMYYSGYWQIIKGLETCRRQKPRGHHWRCNHDVRWKRKPSRLHSSRLEYKKFWQCCWEYVYQFFLIFIKLNKQHVHPFWKNSQNRFCQ